MRNAKNHSIQDSIETSGTSHYNNNDSRSDEPILNLGGGLPEIYPMKMIEWYECNEDYLNKTVPDILKLKGFLRQRLC